MMPDETEDEDWDERGGAPDVEPDKGFIVDVDGFEGPLDLMLALARTHKLDLTHISILYLAKQYLLFIKEARALRLDIAADYLVMAAWLTYLKSRLLLPDEPSDDEEPTGAELAARLAFRLKRLEAMRGAAEILMEGPQLHVDFFPRGQPEGITVLRESVYTAGIYDLLSAYATGRSRKVVSVLRPGHERRKVWSLKHARTQLEKIIGFDCQWAPIDTLLAGFLDDPEEGKTALATAFGASLEMAREGVVELRQDSAFNPLYVRRREGRK